jgi:hypothetical protein
MARNCWEHHKCGRCEGGFQADELGVCPANTAREHDNINRGHHAGRHCWRVAGTLCGGEVQGSIATKIRDCLTCAFFRLVRREEDANFEC